MWQYIILLFLFLCGAHSTKEHAGLQSALSKTGGELKDSVLEKGIDIDSDFEYSGNLSSPGCPSPTDGYPWLLYGSPPKCYLVGVKGPCSDSMKMVYDSFTKNGSCQCDCFPDDVASERPPFCNTYNYRLTHEIAHAFHNETKKCYPFFKRGPCKSGEWFVMDSNSTVPQPICEKQRCPRTKPGKKLNFYSTQTLACESFHAYCTPSSYQNPDDEGKDHTFIAVEGDWEPHCVRTKLPVFVPPSGCKSDEIYSPSRDECVKPFGLSISEDVGPEPTLRGNGSVHAGLQSALSRNEGLLTNIMLAKGIRMDSEFVDPGNHSHPGCPSPTDGYPWVLFGTSRRCYLVGYKGPCPSSTKIVMDSVTGSVSCECLCSPDYVTNHSINVCIQRTRYFYDAAHVKYPHTQICYPFFMQEPCNSDEWFVMDSTVSGPICQKRPDCPANLFRNFRFHLNFYSSQTSSCEALNGPCTPTSYKNEGDKHKNHTFVYVQGAWEPQCVVQKPKTEFVFETKTSHEISLEIQGLGPAFSCPSGEIWSKLRDKCLVPGVALVTKVE